ncbi:MAG: sigma-70 family RNA polymerase sigma factor [Streptosporangiales bacterium]|nr:sigma-70 family RNA polymerase sigma factor [Streptosporangiales bacterium]
MTRGEEFLRATLPALDLVHNLARRLARDTTEAEDLVQETYTRAWAAWVAGRAPLRVEPWLATICLNAGRDRARRGRDRREVPWDSVPEPAAQASVEAEAIEHVQREIVERTLRSLPEEQRIAVTLMDLCGFTAAETAAIVGAPRGTVLARVHRGRKVLARLIDRGEVTRDAPRP